MNTSPLVTKRAGSSIMQSESSELAPDPEFLVLSWPHFLRSCLPAPFFQKLMSAQAQNKMTQPRNICSNMNNEYTMWSKKSNQHLLNVILSYTCAQIFWSTPGPLISCQLMRSFRINRISWLCPPWVGKVMVPCGVTETSRSMLSQAEVSWTSSSSIVVLTEDVSNRNT